MRVIKLPKQVYYRHIATWLCLFIYLSIGNSGTFISTFVYNFFVLLNFSLAYYALILIVFPNFFDNRKWLFLFCFILIAFCFVLFDYINWVKTPSFFGSKPLKIGFPSAVFIKDSLLLFSFVAFLSVGSFLNWRSIERAKVNAEKEKNMLSKELNFLKNQFHSHLTFNFLNFCYSKMLKSSPKAAESIEDFSEMLRYSLISKQEEFVLLQNEIDYIYHFISIQKCLSSQVFVDFKVEGEIETVLILPKLLAVFVENSFKHGDFSSPQNPICISIATNNKVLFFSIKNKKNNHVPITTTGIGLTNVKQLLNLFYPEKYTLDINESQTHYKTELTIII